MEWKQVKLSEICISISDGDHSAPPQVENGIPFITISNITENNEIDFQKTKFVPQNYYDSLKGCRKAEQGDILYSVVGTFGKPVYVKDDRPFVFQRHIAILKPNEFVDNRFLYYTLLSPAFYQKADQMAIGAVQRTIGLNSLRDASICIPETINDQRKIANILSSLDAKIENNNKINANLEAQAAALFKSWFVDFEPFRDGEFVESELGMIPKGWKVGTYEDIIEGTVSGDWGKENPQGNYTHEVACIRGCDFQDMSNGVRGKTPQRYILEKNYTTKRLNDKDILVEISGGTPTVSTGRVCLVSDQMLQKYNYDIVCTNFCRVVRPLVGFSAYIYYSWLYKYNKKVMFGYENGTSGIKNFQMKDFLSKEPVLIPSLDCLVKFQKLIDTLQNTIQSNGTENTKLSSLRDTLLPKLMSGEIELPDDNVLQYCKYYKGETENPFEPATLPYFYWREEANFFNHVYNDPSVYKHWEEITENCGKEAFCIPMDVFNSLPKPTQVMIVMATWQAWNMQPCGGDLYLKHYGKSVEELLEIKELN